VVEDDKADVVVVPERFDEEAFVATVEFVGAVVSEVEDEDVAAAGCKFAKAVLFIICAPNSIYPVGQFVQYWEL
jgi:hypothetical protein